MTGIKVREELIAKIRAKYDAEGCGICEKKGADILWFSPFSRGAHSVCFGTIKNVEADLMNKIDIVFKENIDRNMAHIRAVRAVQQELGNISLKKYLETQGVDQLKSLFDSVGLVAALTIPAKL
jgi:hypothetical protein